MPGTSQATYSPSETLPKFHHRVLEHCQCKFRTLIARIGKRSCFCCPSEGSTLPPVVRTPCAKPDQQRIERATYQRTDLITRDILSTFCICFKISIYLAQFSRLLATSLHLGCVDAQQLGGFPLGSHTKQRQGDFPLSKKNERSVVERGKFTNEPKGIGMPASKDSVGTRSI